VGFFSKCTIENATPLLITPACCLRFGVALLNRQAKKKKKKNRREERCCDLVLVSCFDIGLSMITC